MYKKIVLIFAFLVSLNAQMVDGVPIVVKGNAITLLEITNFMASSKMGVKQTTDVLIRKKLEEAEAKERAIVVSSEEVYDDIKQRAAKNKMTVSAFYDAVRESNGLTSTELKEQIKEQIMSQKLYAAIANEKMSEPTSDEIADYFELHKAEFTHPGAFTVIVHVAKDQARLQEKIDNPMFYSPDIEMSEQVLEYDKISPKLAALLENTPLNKYTEVVPDGRGKYMSFYMKAVQSAEEAGVEGAKNQIISAIMASKREQVLTDYFARLRLSAEIKMIRMPD